MSNTPSKTPEEIKIHKNALARARYQRYKEDPEYVARRKTSMKKWRAKGGRKYQSDYMHDYYLRKKNDPEYKAKRKIYMKIYMKKWDADHLQYRQVFRDAYKQKMRIYIDELRQEPCTDCKQCFPIDCMEFDHVPERGKKLFAISEAAGGQTFSEKKFTEELAKCDLVCANCHRIRTATRRRALST